MTYEDKSAEIAGHVIDWLDQRQTAGKALVAELAKLKAQVGHGGASRSAAELIVSEVEARGESSPRVRPPKPHFVPGMRVESSGGI